MVTRFGKFCRNVRMDNGQLLYEMAKQLEVSSAFLSRVENGKAKPPVEWKSTITSLYQLTDQQKSELVESIDEARENIIRMDMFSQTERDMMFAFARQLDGLDEKEKDKWKKMLKM